VEHGVSPLKPWPLTTRPAISSMLSRLPPRSEALPGPAVDGIDIGWLGHFDLDNSLGIPGQFEHPDFLGAVDRLVAACRTHGKPARVLAGSVETAEARRPAVPSMGGLQRFTAEKRDQVRCS
jgi:hypothetical protein